MILFLISCNKVYLNDLVRSENDAPTVFLRFRVTEGHSQDFPALGGRGGVLFFYRDMFTSSRQTRTYQPSECYIEVEQKRGAGSSFWLRPCK